MRHAVCRADPLTDKIGQSVADFLAADMKRGIIPSTFLPLQSGVGNIANAVLGALGRDKTIPAFEMYTEVIQNSVIGLIRDGRVKFGSACSLTVTKTTVCKVSMMIWTSSVITGAPSVGNFQ